MFELFIVMTISVAIGVLLASVLAVLIMLNPKVIKAYMKYVMTAMEAVANMGLEDFDKEEKKAEESE